MSSSSAAVDVQTELVAASRERVVSRLSRREQLTHGSTAFLFVIAAASLAAHDLSPNHRAWLFAPLFVATIALASRVELEGGSGFASPVELVVIPMLFALPAGQVPAVVALGLVLGQLPSYLRGRVPTQRIIVAIGNASYTLAPAFVFVLFYDRSAGAGEWAAVTAVAVCAQFIGDGAISTVPGTGSAARVDLLRRRMSCARWIRGKPRRIALGAGLSPAAPTPAADETVRAGAR